MAKYEIIEVENYPEFGPNDLVINKTLIVFRNSAGLMDSIIILSSDYTPARIDAIIDKALLERK